MQTVGCHDCKELYDAVTRLRVFDEALARERLAGANLPKGLNSRRSLKRPPGFQSALNRLAYLGAKAARWLEFDLQCPVSPLHRVQAWNDPDRCPKCGVYLEKGALPFRIWE